MSERLLASNHVTLMLLHVTILKHTAVATDYRYQLVSLDISIPRLLNTRHNVFQYGVISLPVKAIV